MEWKIYPQGLGHFVRHTANYRDLPIYITKKGLASYDRVENGQVINEQHIRYLNAHQDQVEGAIAEGHGVRGYTIWSLMDNYEWAVGYDKRFGLVHIDFDTLDRTPKASWHAVQAVMVGRGVNEPLTHC